MKTISKVHIIMYNIFKINFDLILEDYHQFDKKRMEMGYTELRNSNLSTPYYIGIKDTIGNDLLHNSLSCDWNSIEDLIQDFSLTSLDIKL